MNERPKPKQFELLTAPVTNDVSKASRTPVVGDMHLHVLYWAHMGKVVAHNFPAEWFMDDTQDGYIQGCMVNKKVADLVKLGHLNQIGSPLADGLKARLELTPAGSVLLEQAKRARLKGRPAERAT